MCNAKLFFSLHIKIPFVNDKFQIHFPSVSIRERVRDGGTSLRGGKSFRKSGAKNRGRYSSQLSVVFRDLPRICWCSMPAWRIPAVCKYQKHILRSRYRILLSSLFLPLNPHFCSFHERDSDAESSSEMKAFTTLTRKFEGTFIESEENMIPRKLWFTIVLFSLKTSR